MQPPAGQPSAVIVHAAAEVAAVRALARPARFLSAPGALGFLGAAWFASLLREGGADPALGIGDAGAAPGFALAGLRHGLGAVVLDPGCAAFAALAAEAARRGALLLPEAPAALDLARLDLRREAGLRHLAQWLG
jgi:hypothetical protein